MSEGKQTEVKDRPLTTPEAAEVLGVTAGTLEVWRCTKRHDLPYVRVGRAIRYRLADVLAWMERNTVTA